MPLPARALSDGERHDGAEVRRSGDIGRGVGRRLRVNARSHAHWGAR